MTFEELQMLQALPLDIKIEKTKARIREWVRYYGENGVYISFSGGKDSTVLLHIVREIYPDIPAVFFDTGLEYPEIREFVKQIDNVTWIKPNKNFKEILTTCGYPVISKEQSQYLHEIRYSTEKTRNRRLYGDSKGRFKLSKKYYFMMDAPFDVSHKCCYYMKKAPSDKYRKQTGRVPILGNLAQESTLRRQMYLKNGCNTFEGNRPNSSPMGFWRESDVLEYIVTHDIKIAKCYGEIVEQDGEYTMNGLDRTGCIFCAYGVHLDDEPNRFQMLKETHPKLYDYCINGGCYKDGKWIPDSKGLGMGKVLDYINVPY